MPTNNRMGILGALENILDMFINAASLVMAFVVTVLFIKPVIVTLDSPSTIIAIFVSVILQSFLFMAFDLYRPIPFVKASSMLANIIRVNIIYLAMLELLTFFLAPETDKYFIALWAAIALLISTVILVSKKNLIIAVIRVFRKKQYNLRRVIIIGDNTATAQDFVRQVATHPECGMMIIGFVGDKIDEKVVGCEKLGSFKDLARILDTLHPDDAVFAIDAYNKRHLINLVNMCDDRFVKVYFLPVIYGFFKVASQIETIGSLPVINIHHTPLDNPFNAFIKRAIDIVGSLALIILTSPIMIAAAIGVKLSSPGPIFFKQERVGKMGKTFMMLKFRSMRINVGSDSEWTTPEDPRKTRFGNFIRMTSIDELPQLFNVLAGDMSLVGPRPEIPYYVEHFRETVPLYMIKHYVKPGMTGLAQIRGLRGDTSIEDRIQADIEYIENWTLGLDIAILLKTPLKAINKQERYVKDDGKGTVEVVEMREPEAPDTTEYKGKILYAASTISHINNFHLPYIEALRREGYLVKIMARGDGADYNIPFEKKYLSSANTACRRDIRRIIEREGFDIIFLNTSLAAFHIRLALPKKNRPKVINMVHGYLFGDNTPFFKRLILETAEKLLRDKTDHVIVMNEWDKAIAEKRRLALGNVYYCHGMGAVAEPVEISAEKLRREHSATDSFVLAFVGELSDRKNQEFLIGAMLEIKERIPNAVLWLVGDGIGKEKLKALAERVDISESVVFLGRRENACDYMRAADLYVSASEIEGMPFNLIEAMGCGKTVLASSVKGHTDLIEDGKSGFLYKAGSLDDFVDKVMKIYNNELVLKAEDIEERYREFMVDTVYPETLEVIKRSLVE